MGTTHQSTATTRRARRDDEPPYARLAFWNPYNISLFLGGVVLGVATDNAWLSILTCAAEVLWMIFAPDSKLLQSLWFDRIVIARKKADDADRREERIGLLTPQDSTRFAYLCGQKQIIERLARDNPSLTVDLLTTELAKLDELLDDFIELGVNATRAEQHTATFDFPAMRRSWHIYDDLLRKHGVGDPRRDVAAKNMDVLRQRRARYEDLCRTIQVTRGQMELIEQTFRLLGDEIMTMASPQDLGGRLDELRVAVDAVRETADETYGIVDEADVVDADADADADVEVEVKRRHVS